MPSWFIHLATAKELNEKLKIKDINSFLIGNLMPDSERYVVNDFSVFVPYDITHFACIDKNNEKFPKIDKFLSEYKEKLYNDVVLGYLTHLLTDFFWNSIVHSPRYTIRNELGECIGVKTNNGTNMNGDKHLRAKAKHTDFAIFENHIIKEKQYIMPKYENNMIEKTSIIKEIPYNSEDIKKIINYCENRIKNCETDFQYTIFNEEQMIKEHKNCVEYIIDYLKKIKI